MKHCKIQSFEIFAWWVLTSWDVFEKFGKTRSKGVFPVNTLHFLLFPDDSSTFSDITDSSFSNANCSRSPDLHQMNLHPMVYQLPSSTPYHPPTASTHNLPHSPIFLPPVSLLSPNQDNLIITTTNLPSILSNETKPLDRLPSLKSPDGDASLEKLPSMSITAPSWWPEK